MAIKGAYYIATLHHRYTPNFLTVIAVDPRVCQYHLSRLSALGDVLDYGICCTTDPLRCYSDDVKAATADLVVQGYHIATY